MQWLAGLIVKFILEKVWGFLAGAAALLKKKRDDSASIAENEKKMKEAEASGDEERETRATEDLLNNTKS